MKTSDGDRGCVGSRGPRRPTGRARVALLVAALALVTGGAACSGGDDGDERARTESDLPGESETPGSGASDGDGDGDDQDADRPGAAVTTACDRLEDLAYAILGVHEAESMAEVGEAVEEPLGAFLEAAAASGDDELEEISLEASEGYATYAATGANADFDGAIDRAGARCGALGAPNVFPQEP